MAQNPLDFRPIAQGGDSPTAAFVKLDGNDKDLDERVTAAKSTADTANTTAGNALGTANAAVPKSTLAGYGVGVSTLPTVANIDAASITKLEKFQSGTSLGTYPPNQNYGTLMTSAYGSAAQYSQLAISVLGNEMAFRYYNGGWQPWSRVWHSNNTTVDSNGFIKKAN